MKKAYYLAFPDKPFEVIIRDDGATQSVFSSDAFNPGTLLHKLEEEGYEVFAFRAHPPVARGIGDVVRQYERITTDDFPDPRGLFPIYIDG